MRILSSAAHRGRQDEISIGSVVGTPDRVVLRLRENNLVRPPKKVFDEGFFFIRGEI